MRDDVNELAGLFRNPESGRQYAEAMRGFRGFEMFCSECVELDGPRCCRTLAVVTPERRSSSWWRRLLARKEPA